MANLKGLASVVSALRAERGSLVGHLRHVDAALSVLGKLGGGGFLHETEAYGGTAGEVGEGQGAAEEGCLELRTRGEK